jgi:hypothetical protein
MAGIEPGLLHQNRQHGELLLVRRQVGMVIFEKVGRAGGLKR